MMTWTNLAVLGVGGALVSVPIILHLLMQPKPKQMVFPAMRFLKERRQTNRSRMRIRHFLLLLLRCLLIGFVAIALAGPSVASSDFGNWLTLGGIGFSGFVVAGILLFSFFRQNRNWVLIGILGALFLGHLVFGGLSASKLVGSESAQLIGDDQAPVAALVVIDTSPRMEYLNENKTSLAKAKEAGQWLVSQFPIDSQVCVMATDGDRPFFSVDVAAAERRIETLETDFSGSSIPAALLEGLKILNKAPQERKEIYIVTDLTQESWSGENANPLVKQLDKRLGISVFVFDVGVENPTNLAMTQLQLSDVEISEAGRLSISTEVQRQGPAVQRTIKMLVEKHEPPMPVVRDEYALFPTATFDGQSITKDIRENSSVPVKFTFSQPLEIGIYHGRVEVEGQDGLAIDNQRFFTFRVGQVKRALIVHPTNVYPRIIESLLAPRDKVEAGTAKYESETTTQKEFLRFEDLSIYDVVYLLDPEPMAEPIWERLEGFVREGGGLGIFLGHNAAAGGVADPSFLTPAAQRVLSGTLEQQWFNEEPDLFLSPKELIHPVFNSIRNNETTVLWNRFPVFIHWGIETVENDKLPTQTLLRFGNREPALIERTIGAGRVLVMTTPITEYSSVDGRPIWNLLISGNMVPAYLLLDGIASYLVQGDASSLNVEVGQIATHNNDLKEFPETYQAFSPQADKPPTVLNTVEGKVRYRFIDYPGHYRLKGVMDQSVTLRGFSANIGNSITDLTRIEPDKLDAFLGADNYQLARQKDQIRRQQGATRRGREFYPLLVLMMLVVLAIEYLMSNRFYSI